MRLSDYLDADKLAYHIQEGLVDARHHNELPLTILSYGRKAIYDNLWDDVTERCRGLIVNRETGEIVSRPFEKFFNFETSYRPETHLENLPNSSPTVMDKLDGSLGIYYRVGKVEGIASKGSFHSEHAEWATVWYRKHCPNSQWPEGYTPIFEMICESVQHHVVHYGKEGLVLLALVKRDTGEEADYNTLYHWAKINGLNVPDIFNKTVGEIVGENRPEAEGYVLSWPIPGRPPLKLKFKFPDFLQLQRIAHSATPKRIFEAISEGNGALLADCTSHGSPELKRFVKGWMNRLNEEYFRTLKASTQIVSQALHVCTSRKEFALHFNTEQNRKYAPVCFAILDEKDYRMAIWRLLEPMVQGQRPFAVEDEE